MRALSGPIRCRSRTPPSIRSIYGSWRNGCAAIGRRNFSTTRGRLRAELAALAPSGQRRMGANPNANGGMLLRDLRMPNFRDYAVDIPEPGIAGIGDTHVLGKFLRDVLKLNAEPRNFRIFGPDETLSNGLEAVFEAGNRQWLADTTKDDEFLAPAGPVMEMLSEHQCEGWLEGYLLTGRHGLFNCYEAFIHIVDSMFNQHAKWLKVTAGLPWRRKIASLNYLLSSHVWRQDHNGFTHQDPGFIDHVVNKKGGDRARLPAAGRQLSLVGGGSLFAQPPLRQRGRGGQTSGAAVAVDGCAPSIIAARASASGSGPATINAASPTWSWPVPATCRRWRRLPRFRFCGASCPH